MNAQLLFLRLMKATVFCMILFLAAGFINKHDDIEDNSHLPIHSVNLTDTLVDSKLKITLPEGGKLINGKPVGKNWINMISSLDEWNADQRYWKLENGVLQGDYNGGEFHNYSWTKKQYKDFELQALVKLEGKDANSGVCIRIQPVNADNVPGYQVDMGAGYWGCLWEEKRAGMVQKFPDELAEKIVKSKDWNHYYVIAKGHHIQAWLNGVKTIDITHSEGLEQGAIGFQLCHGDKHTVLAVQSLFIKEIK